MTVNTVETAVNINELAALAKTDDAALTALYKALGPEKRRFVAQLEVRGAYSVDGEAVFNDAFLDVIDEYRPGNNFVGLLYLRLNSKKVTEQRSYLRDIRRQMEHSQLIGQFLNVPVSHDDEVAFISFVSELDEQLQQAVSLLVNGYSLREAGKTLQMNWQTLRNRLRKAFEQFRSM